MILKTPSKEGIAVPILGWRKLSLELVNDFPKVNWLVSYGDKWLSLDPGGPWLQL